MVESEHKLVIQRPPEVVFAAATDVTGWPKWVSFISELKSASPGAMAVGSRYEFGSKLLGASFPLDTVVTEYDPPHSVTYHTERPLPGTIRWVFTPDGDSTGIALYAEADPSALPVSVSSLLIGVMEKMIVDELSRLKTRLESE
jgi:uncharacterized protein YndB with AHSA1/START domain